MIRVEQEQKTTRIDWAENKEQMYKMMIDVTSLNVWRKMCVVPDFYGSQIGFHMWKQRKVSADVWELQKSVNQKLFLKKYIPH